MLCCSGFWVSALILPYHYMYDRVIDLPESGMCGCQEPALVVRTAVPEPLKGKYKVSPILGEIMLESLTREDRG